MKLTQMLLLELLLLLLHMLKPLFEGVRAPPNPGLSFRRGGLRSGRDGRVVGPVGMLGGQNGKKKLKKRNGSWKTAVAGSVCFRHRVCTARLAFTQIYMV